MTVRFLHTADWQLGMPAAFLGDEARPRFQQDRLDVVRRIGEVARREEAAYFVVAGDVFDTNWLSRGTVGRALEALATMPVPVLLLPGNHDPLDAGSLYRRHDFLEGKPPHVYVLEEPGVQDQLRDVLPPGLEVVAAPWTGKHPAADPVNSVLRTLEPATGSLRVAVGHGGIDVLTGRDDLDAVRLKDLEEAVRQGIVHYVALGDRHSVTRVGGTGRIWYAGAPEPTAFDEEQPGYVLLVDLSPAAVDVRPIPVAAWRFETREAELVGEDDAAALVAWLESRPDKARTAVRLTLSGRLPPRARAALDDGLASAGEWLAWLQVEADGLRTIVSDEELAALPAGSFARAVADRLLAMAAEASADEAAVAEAALHILLEMGVAGHAP